jgi:hypothetical protein
MGDTRIGSGRLLTGSLILRESYEKFMRMTYFIINRGLR